MNPLREDASSNKEQAEDDDGGAERPVIDTSTLEVLSAEDVVATVRDILDSSLVSPQPCRFVMENIVRVDDELMDVLRASSLSEDTLSHVEHIVETEDTSAGAKGSFAARVFRQRPGVVYAVRYWVGLKDKAALTMALEEVREAWSMCCRLEPVSLLNRKKTSPKRGSGSHEGGEIQRKLELSDRPGQLITEKQNHLAPLANETPARRDHESIGESPSPDINISTAVLPRTSQEDNDARGETDDTRLDNNGNNMLQVLSFPPEATPGSQNTRRKRSSMLQMLGFSVQLDRPSGTACVALVSEWPGIGSLHDLLRRKAGGVPAPSQENLLRWTRQVAEGLVQTCENSCGGSGGGAALRVSAQNVYLFRRPKDDFQDDRTVVLDAKVAPFLWQGSTLSSSDALDAEVSLGCLLPPEVLCAKPTGIVKLPSSPTRSRIERRHRDREAADVWGIGTLAFELATGRVAGPTPLALRPLRDLMRDVPIGPRLIYGDVARGVMRLALRRKPGDRARAVEIAAVVEEIAARTLRRSHTARDRQSRLQRLQLQAARQEHEKDEGDGGGANKDKNQGDEGDNGGYDQALLRWKVNEAVERAGGRARAFLRQLWFNSLSEDDKRRIRHRRRCRKENQKARDWRRRRVRAATFVHWTPVEVANWVSHLLKNAEASRKLRLLAPNETEKGNISILERGDNGINIGSVDVSRNGEERAPSIRLKPDAAPTTPAFTLNAAAAKGEGDMPHASINTFKVGRVDTDGGVLVSGLPLGDKEGADRNTEGVVGENRHGSSSVNLCGGDKLTGKNGDRSEGGHGKYGVVDVGDIDDDDDDNVGDDDDRGRDDDDDNDDDDSRSGDEDAADIGWGLIEAGERTGYTGATVESFTGKEEVDGLCIVKAMKDAMERAEDTLTRFIKSSVKLLRPAEVEQKRVELMVRELLTVRPYSTSGQLKMRALAVTVVRSAEAPRELTEEEICAQLPAVGRVLAEGYRHETTMAEHGLDFAAAKIQGLARGKRARWVVSSIWRRAEAFAEKVVRGEREAAMKQEADRKAKEKEEALEREKEEARQYRLRLAPRVSSVACRSMDVSLPPFLVAVTRVARRFLVMETTVVAPPSPRLSGENARGRPSAASANATSNSSMESGGQFCDDGDNGHGEIRVLLRQGAAVEVKASADNESSLQPASIASATTDFVKHQGEDNFRTKGEAREVQAERTANSFVRAVGEPLGLCGLRPSTTYRVTLEVPILVRDDLLESARSAGLWEAVRSLEASAEAGANVDVGGGDDVGGDVGGGVGGGVGGDFSGGAGGVSGVGDGVGGGVGGGGDGTERGSASPSCNLASALSRGICTNEYAAGSASASEANYNSRSRDTFANEGGAGPVDAGAAGAAVSVSSFTGSIDVETLPDVPDVVLCVNCKVLTSASATDPRNPASVLSLRQWQSPYPGVADMDNPSSKEKRVLAPGRPEPIVSLHWSAPQSNGLDICSYLVERRIGGKGAWKEIGSQGVDSSDSGGGKNRRGGGTRRRWGLPEALDTPLRTVDLDTLMKVAVQRLALSYRVSAENTLGMGGPSEPVEVNLQAFLGHLRAQEGGRPPVSPTTSSAPRPPCTAAAAPPGQEPLPHYVLPSVARSLRPVLPSSIYASGVSSASDATAFINVAADTDTTACSDSPSKIEQWAKQQSREPFKERGVTQGSEISMDNNRLAAFSRPSFDGDFMGLRGYREARVHSLFAPPFASSLPLRRHRKAPAARELPGEQRRQGSVIDDSRPYPLPPIAVVLGISGDGRRGNAAGIEAGLSATGSDGEEWKQRGIVEYAEGFHATGLGDLSSSITTDNNNNVFHAFLHLGRRLPGRLRRDQEGQEA